MNKRVVLAVFLSLLLSASIFAVLFIVPIRSHPADIIVPDDYEKIQWAIGNASDGDTIFVRAGTYYERITIKKSLTLIGENKSTTVVDGNGAAEVIYTFANNVTISSFTIKNGFHGVLLTGSHNCNVTGNVILDNYEGIHVRYSDGNFISGNQITSNRGDGIYMRSADDTTIVDNVITQNGRGGIWIGESIGTVLTDNTFSKNYFGIMVDHSTRATVARNVISHNYYQGLVLRFASESFLRNNNMMRNLYNLQVYGKSLSDFTLDMDTSNTVNGKPVYYLVNKKDFLIDPSAFPNVGYLGLINSKNITVRGLTLTDNYEGILLAHTSNSTIENVTATSNFYGIYLCSSECNTVRNNDILNDIRGIFISHSKNNIIESNRISNSTNDGIHLEYSNNNTVSLNTAINNSYGIQLFDSGNNTLTGNNASNNRYNFGVSGSSFFHFNNYVDTSNTVDGKPIYYLIGVANAVYDIHANAGTIYLINCNNISIKDLTLTKNGQGIFLWNSTNNKIENSNVSNNECGIVLDHSSNNVLIYNNVSANEYKGIKLYHSINNIVTSNTAINTDVGIRLHNSRNNTINRNTFTNNDWEGISLIDSNNNTVTGNSILNNTQGIHLKDSSNNTLYRNNFINNTQQVFDYSCGHPYHSPSINVWDDGYPSGGNYWSDYNGTDFYSGPYQNETGSDGIGDPPYIIDENNQDNYPLMNPWTPTPPVITATIDIDPDTLNLKSRGKWITCYIELPEGYDVNDVDRATILLNGTIPVDPFWVDKPLESVVGDYDDDGIPDLMVKFSRTEVSEYIRCVKGITHGNVTLTITMGLYDGTFFEGSDMIGVRMPGDVNCDECVNIYDLVVPEFPLSAIPPIFMILSLITVIFMKPKKKKE